MRSHDDDNPPGVDNAFHPTFLALAEGQDDPQSAHQALHGGYWRVFPLADGRWGVFRDWESPVVGDEPQGVFRERPVALLACSFMPLVARDRILWSRRSTTGMSVHHCDQELGHLSRAEPEMIEALDLAFAMVRTPESLAFLLEAVGPATLEAVGRILARRGLGGG